MTAQRRSPLSTDPAIFGSYTELLRTQARTRIHLALFAVALLTLVVLAFWRLDVSLWWIVKGIGDLGTFVVLIIPPTPGSWANALIYLHSLAETVAIAFLGTLLAAIIAFPLGLLAAYNVVPIRIFQFMRPRFEFGIAARLQALAWWDWSHEQLRGALEDFRNLTVESFLAKHGG